MAGAVDLSERTASAVRLGLRRPMWSLDVAIERLSKSSLSKMLRLSGREDVYSGGVEWGARLGARSPVGWDGGGLLGC